MLVVSEPTTLRFKGYDERQEELKKLLTYVDKSVDFDLRNLKKSFYKRQAWGEEAFNEAIEKLKEQRVKSLLFEDEKGLWTYSGLKRFLQSSIVGGDDVQDDVIPPEPRIIPWSTVSLKQERSYQEKAKLALLNARHAAVEIGTGLGKTLIALNIVKELGLKTLVMAPSLSIAEQLYDEFVKHLGKNKVGAYFDGKKVSNRLVTIGIFQGLCRIEEGSQAYEDLKDCQVFIADESHLTPATTLQKVCFGIAKNAPYRFFFSGTQLRGDGLDMLLEGIIGEIVFSMTVKEGVDQGFLARPFFRQVNVPTDSKLESDDINKLTRRHLYYNPFVNKTAAFIANMSVTREHPVLVLIDEMEQFTKLLPMLKHPFGFAHGGVTKDNKKKIPEAYWKSDPKELVKRFNAKEFPILIGTSCIATGTDILPVKDMIYLRGGRSEVELRQGVGRCTRIDEGKKFCNVWDFRVDQPTMIRHADDRAIIMDDIYGPVEQVTF